MPETVEQPRKPFSKADLKIIAEYIRVEFAKRQGNRRDLEKHWKEIDRQVRMSPRIREVNSGEKKD
jgi:hypothetical protein